ncbi:hypothetical protein GCM10009775_24130 [Microbacterium aoyamense]|uniref:t-SNARE coiled-coil homology domain-containing protein n=1 Tax=Microbacterium aoyamense TaxID=344166 RepID=A0ABN2PSJ0_9MICO|nr:hypothetical protein [Microbacterium aoyamense]
MPMSPSDTERKIQQLDNDVQGIYEMISRIDGTLRRQHSRLEEISMDQAGIKARLDGHDERFDGIDKRFDGIDKRFDGIDKRFDGIDQRFETLESKLDRVISLVGGDATA